MCRTLFCLFFLVATGRSVHAGQPAPPTKEPFLAESLDELLAGKRSLETFVLEVKWTEADKESSLTIHGDGLGIHWQGKQFQLSKEQRLDLLRKLKAANFTAMPAYFAAAPKDPDWQRPRGPGHGSILLRIGDQSKVVPRDSRGPVTEEFARLAKDLLATCINASASGVGADTLKDGLQKVLDQKINLRAVKVEVCYLRHLECHTLEIEGLTAKIHGQGYCGERFKGQKSLRADELRAFIRSVGEDQFYDLPGNVTPKYDILLMMRVRILDKEHYTGGFGYSSTKSPAEEVRRFEAVFRASDALHPAYEYEKKKDR